jgi:hypothetical protein
MLKHSKNVRNLAKTIEKNVLHFKLSMLEKELVVQHSQTMKTLKPLKCIVSSTFSKVHSFLFSLNFLLPLNFLSFLNYLNPFPLVIPIFPHFHPIWVKIINSLAIDCCLTLYRERPSCKNFILLLPLYVPVKITTMSCRLTAKSIYLIRYAFEEAFSNKADIVKILQWENVILKLWIRGGTWFESDLRNYQSEFALKNFWRFLKRKFRWFSGLLLGEVVAL